MDIDLSQPLPRWVLKYPNIIVAASKTSGGDGKTWTNPEFRRDVLKFSRKPPAKAIAELNQKALRLL